MKPLRIKILTDGISLVHALRSLICSSVRLVSRFFGFLVEHADNLRQQEEKHLLLPSFEMCSFKAKRALEVRGHQIALEWSSHHSRTRRLKIVVANLLRVMHYVVLTSRQNVCFLALYLA